MAKKVYFSGVTEKYIEWLIMMDNFKGQEGLKISNSVSIRPAQADDAGEIISLFKETVLQTCANDYTSQQLTVWSNAGNDRSRWLSKIDRQYFVVAISDSAIVGFGSFEKPDYLDLLYVHKGRQKLGIASKILESLEKEFRKSGLKKLNADVSVTARGFFERRGFNVLKEIHVAISDVAITNYKMEKIF